MSQSQRPPEDLPFNRAFAQVAKSLEERGSAMTKEDCMREAKELVTRVWADTVEKKRKKGKDPHFGFLERQGVSKEVVQELVELFKATYG